MQNELEHGFTRNRADSSFYKSDSDFTSVLNRNEVNVDNSEFEGDVRTMISLVKVTRDIVLREIQEKTVKKAVKKGVQRAV